VSAISKNQTVKVEIKGFKTSHFKESKRGLKGLVNAGLAGHVEFPQSEPADDDIQFSGSRMVSAPDCTRTWDQPRDRWPVFVVEPLSHVPFRPRDLSEQTFTSSDLEWPLLSSTRVRFLRCLGSFVGSDILAGILATGIVEAGQLVVLIDLGTMKRGATLASFNRWFL
jgi:hypothetical protein